MHAFIVRAMNDWEPVEEAVRERLKPGTVLALSGPLGAGKTTFVQGLAAKLGARAKPKSPTFSLVRSYPLNGSQGLQRLLHVDAYRLEAEEDLLPLDLDAERAESGTVIALEWPERAEKWLARLWPDVVRLTIRTEGPVRHVELS
jgi:tRNA threonylcarbamoyladenosine biosynthesis protein TsaE